MENELKDHPGRDWVAEANLYWQLWLKAIKMNRHLRHQNRQLRKTLAYLLGNTAKGRDN